MVIKIGLRCNFFCVGAGLSKKFAEDKKTAVLLNTHSTVYAELNFTKTLHDISIIYPLFNNTVSKATTYLIAAESISNTYQK